MEKFPGFTSDFLSCTAVSPILTVNRVFSSQICIAVFCMLYQYISVPHFDTVVMCYSASRLHRDGAAQGWGDAESYQTQKVLYRA
jgi:hypothetical protein